MTLRRLIAASGLSIVCAAPATANGIFLFGDNNWFGGPGGVETLFSNIMTGNTWFGDSNYLGNRPVGPGFPAGFENGAITAANLAGYEYLVLGYSPSVLSYTQAEIDTIKGYYDAGGSLFMVGEYTDFLYAWSAKLNDLLGTLGSTLQISPTSISDNSNQTTAPVTVSGTPFAAGVTSYGLSAGAEVLPGANGEVVLGGVADTGTYANFVVYEGDYTVSAPTLQQIEAAMAGPLPTVPVPAGIVLLGSAMAAFAAIRRRRTVQTSG